MAADLTISVDIDARKTKAGANEAKKNIKDVREETDQLKKSSSAADRDVSGLSTQLGGMATQLKGLHPIILAIGAGLLAVAAAAVVAAKAAFELTKAFAAYVTEVSKANEMTGVSVELLSALKVQAELTGTSFENVTEGIKNFAKTVGDANTGSKEASAKLLRLGIDGKKAAEDLSGAFEQSVKKVLSVREGVDQVKAATDAWGDSGPKLLPFLKQFGGDMDRIKKEAQELGLMLSVDDVRAAKEFNKAFAEVQAVLRGIGLTLGRELLPIVRDVFRDIGGWLIENKAEVKSWALTVVDAVDLVIKAVRQLGIVVENQLDAINVANAIAQRDPVAIAAAVQGYQTRAQSRSERLSQTLQGRQYTLSGAMGGSVAGDPYTGNPDAQVRPGRTPRAGRSAGISPAEEQAKRLSEMIRDLQLDIDFFGQTSEEAAVRQQLMRDGVLGVNQALADQAIALAQGLDKMKAKADADKAAADAAKKLKEQLVQIETSGRDDRTRLDSSIAQITQEIALGRELTDVEKALHEQLEARILLQHQLEDAGFSDKQVANAIQVLETEQRETTKKIEKLQVQRKLNAAQQAYRNLISGLDSEIADLTAQLAEYTTGLQATRVEILLNSEAYKKLGAEEQKAALARAQQIDGLREAIKAQEEARAAYEDFYDTIRNGLETLAEQGFGAFFKNVMRMFQSFLIDLAAKWLTSKFFNMFFKGGNQQAASSSGSGGGGIFGAIQQAIFGGGTRGSSGQVSGGTPPFNPGYFNGSSGGSGSSIDFGNLGSILHSTQDTTSRTGGGGGFGFGKGQLAGTLGVIGGGASVLGGLIGGRVGGFISNIGTGVALGAQIGSIIPGVGTAIGAVIGGAVGLIASIFGGDPKRKRDKNEKMPQLTRGFTDALAELRQLVADVRTLRVSPEGAISRATELRNAIASGFGIQFESNKYRRQAQTLIASRLREADLLIEDLRKAAEVSNAATERERRILPEFASGVFMGRTFTTQFEQFKRRNGILPGVFTGGDTMPAMLAPGEMVLNPAQQSRVRSNAGMDPFVGAGIPGYANRGGDQQQSGGGDLHVTVYLDQDQSGMWIATAKSPDGKKVIADVVQEKFRSDEMKTNRRGV